MSAIVAVDKHHLTFARWLDLANKDKRINPMICAILFGALLFLVHYIVELDRQTQQIHLQERILAQAGDLRTRLEQQINTTLNLTMGSLVYVSSHPDITQDEFATFAKEIILRAPYVQNLGLAKDNIISHIYPLAGNEKALGLRYMDHPQQSVAVIRAIETRKTVIAGPVNLVQGGQGFISRIPIFLNDPAQTYWGIASLVVKVEPFFAGAGMYDFTRNLDVAIRGKDATGNSGAVFYGDARLFNDKNVIVHILLPVGSWTLAVAPKNGWSTDTTHSIKLFLAGACIAALFCLLLYSLLTKNAALKREQSRVKIASEHKSRFFTNMTHELRTPLTAIFGSIKLLGSGAISPGSIPWIELLKNAERNCQRLQWIVNDILDLKKIESGKMEYHLTHESMLEMIYEAIDEVKQYAEQFQIMISFINEAAVDLNVEVDRMRLLQVMTNLLSNAIKYSPQGSTINIIMSQEANNVHVEIADSGPGIEKHKAETIFNEFEQADQPDVTVHKRVASSGLGLSISKQIIQDHHGKIGCFSHNKTGSVFFFTLPLSTRPAIPATDTTAPDIYTLADEDSAQHKTLLTTERHYRQVK